MKSDQPIFYVYVYLDPRKPGDYNYGEYHFDYEPFYVGKGSKERAYDHLYGNKWNRYVASKIKKIQCICDNPIIIKYQEQLLENESFNIEIKMIKTIGRQDLKRGPLCNQTDGGDGSSGAIVPRDVVERRAEKIRGRKHTPEELQKMRDAHIGRPPITEEKRARLCLAQQNRKPISEETREKMRTAALGIIPSLETRVKLQDSHSKIFWKVTTPTGEEIIIKNLRKYCRDNSIHRTYKKLPSGRKVYMSRGWKCEKVKE